MRGEDKAGQEWRRVEESCGEERGDVQQRRVEESRSTKERRGQYQHTALMDCLFRAERHTQSQPL